MGKDFPPSLQSQFLRKELLFPMMPIIPPPYKYKVQFDALRSMGFPAKEIVAALDSADGEVEVAAAMLLSSTAQMIEEHEVPSPPPSVLQQMYASQPPPPAAQQQTQQQQTHTTAASAATMQNYDYPEETKKYAKKSNDTAEIVDLLLEYHPDGID